MEILLFLCGLGYFASKKGKKSKKGKLLNIFTFTTGLGSFIYGMALGFTTIIQYLIKTFKYLGKQINYLRIKQQKKKKESVISQPIPISNIQSNIIYPVQFKQAK